MPDDILDQRTGRRSVVIVDFPVQTYDVHSRRSLQHSLRELLPVLFLTAMKYGADQSNIHRAVHKGFRVEHMGDVLPIEGEVFILRHAAMTASRSNDVIRRRIFDTRHSGFVVHYDHGLDELLCSILAIGAKIISRHWFSPFAKS